MYYTLLVVYLTGSALVAFQQAYKQDTIVYIILIALSWITYPILKLEQYYIQQNTKELKWQEMD